MTLHWTAVVVAETAQQIGESHRAPKYNKLSEEEREKDPLVNTRTNKEEEIAQQRVKEIKKEVGAEITGEKIEDRIILSKHKHPEERHRQEIVDSNIEKPTKEAKNKEPRKTEEKTQKGQTKENREIANRWKLAMC